MSTTVVTGAAGHVGANLVRALLAHGKHVRALVHHHQQALEGLDVEIVGVDITDLDSLRCAFAGADSVFHTAGYVSISMHEWQHLEAVNLLGTRNVVDACLQCGVQRLAHFSSVETLLSQPSAGLVDESCSLAPARIYPPYARSKAAGEREVRRALARGLDAVILYPSAILGPHDFRLGFPNAGLLALSDGRLWALVDGGFDWVDVRDVVAGALAAMERAPAGGRYVLSGHWASLRDLADLVGQNTGTPKSRPIFPMWLARIGAPFSVAWSRLTGNRPLYTSAALKPLCGEYRISHARATRDLGYHPRPLDETVRETLQWFQDTGLAIWPVRTPLGDDKGQVGGWQGP